MTTSIPPRFVSVFVDRGGSALAMHRQRPCRPGVASFTSGPAPGSFDWSHP